MQQISKVETLLDKLPAELIARRAVECGSFARAIFHWEEYLRKKPPSEDCSKQYTDMQLVYEQINEPDGIEGISTKVHSLDLNQQILEHKRTGRWSSALSWYETEVAELPGDKRIQSEFLSCFKASGQYREMKVF